MDTLTPMLQQYQQIKSRHKNCILFFRLGDFYEMFAEDARIASPILDVVLTSREAGKAGRIPMCGIPFHAADTYIAKLIKAGMKVAICEQVEDPALAKGLVKREVIRTITSGTYIDDATFESRCLAALAVRNGRFGLAFTDTSSGTIFSADYGNAGSLTESISRILAYECIYPQEAEKEIKELFKSSLLRGKNCVLSAFEDWNFNTDICRKALCEHLGVNSLKGYGIDEMDAAVAASGALLEYMRSMHRRPLRHIDRISLFADADSVFISPAACAGLELDSLMGTIDHTLTSMGRRRLKEWIYHPLKSVAAIRVRQEAVTFLRDNALLRENLEKLLHTVPDVEKSISRISCGTGTAKDLLSLRQTLARIPGLRAALAAAAEVNPSFMLDDLPELRGLLERAVSPDLPLSHYEGKIINKGYDTELDQLRDIQENARTWLKELQAAEIKRSGIGSLKIGFNQVFGYYIEISKSNLDKVPQNYIRRQTLANAERFVTPELKEFEEKILTAEEKILAIERRLVAILHTAILDGSAALHRFCVSLSQLDAVYSLAMVSLQNGYCLPKISDSELLEIRDGRHPVVERSINGPFIPNDTLLDRATDHLVILTGPNMSGKSTYIRQTAILVIMAQMGSYLPAVSASIGIVDKIFTRIGAHDDITKGQSTFMVEMSETAGILNNISERSLVVLDEIGRGTSTFDGLSLAWAIAEHLALLKVRTLFATHFHELTALAEEFPGARNYNVSVKEWNDEVIFLHKIVAGGTDDSYGIYVAKLAGIPKEVVKRSQEILARLELSGSLQEKIRKVPPPEGQLALFAGNTDMLEKIKRDFDGIDLNRLTPLEALNKLQELKGKLNGGK
jgi:DNA mismatch repair protein MutS